MLEGNINVCLNFVNFFTFKVIFCIIKLHMCETFIYCKGLFSQHILHANLRTQRMDGNGEEERVETSKHKCI